MHPRNPYKIPPDFSSLAQAYPPLEQFLINTAKISNSRSRSTTIDFKNDRALRCLTQAIMFRDFGIQLQIPEDRLCPPVPNRMNYVLWIQDIMNAGRTFKTEAAVKIIRGIDIGTGATAIYPFLACNLEEDWEMIGTELDDVSYECALRNVEINKYIGRIIIKQAQRNGTILFPLEDDAASYDFTMCNPPFYSSAQEMDGLSKEKADTPNAVCTGSNIEMIYPDGGEVGFVARMVEESIKFQGRCRWYTSMLGRMSSVIEIVELFRKRKISNYAITEFVQGRTKRWAIGWNLSETRMPDSISRISLHQSHALASYMPLHNTLRQPLRLSTKEHQDPTPCLMEVLKVIEGVNVTKHEDKYSSVFRIEAKENTWSRSERRKRKRRNLEAAAEENVGRIDNVEDQDARQARQNSTPKLVCDVRIILPRRLEDASRNDDPEFSHPKTVGVEWTGLEAGELGGNGICEAGPLELQEDPGYSLECQWIFGTDHRVFETFAGHIGRKLVECFHTA